MTDIKYKSLDSDKEYKYKLKIEELKREVENLKIQLKQQREIAEEYRAMVETPNNLKKNIDNHKEINTEYKILIRNISSMIDETEDVVREKTK